MGLRAQLDGATRPQVQSVDVAKWADLLGGATVMYVRKLAVSEKSAHEQSRYKLNGAIAVNGKKVKAPREVHLDLLKERENMLVRALCEEDGTRLYKDSEIDLVAALPGDLGEVLFEAAMIFNGYRLKLDEDEEEGAEKN